ncbi:Carboxypeptidase regulatory-like domain-containing protein [Haladaptatus litoreus]|uniref:Carboxypeptidase regulatory-like domain-containing protein n=1 Tax=Haladaptatus litoreus TaxID=553468 RepID=A0A1N7DLH2_9EURY|nr:carboxypeptidase-like regulatory domain-containing protein [Haladaptatus litoreus]SIR76713.1 Carboxypeptidase regulatory-like domain-containing protein [Haladaptatus litoreus]
MAQISTHPKLVLLLIFLGVTSLSAPALGASLAHDTGHTQNSISTPLAAQQTAGTTTPNNSSQPRHQDPSKVQSEEELSELEQWMAGQLSSRLGDSTAKLSQSEYQSARSVVGDRYNNLLSKYVEVSGRTEGTKDDKRAKQFKNAQNNQENYADNVSEYRQTYNEYQQAKQNGNDEKARELARQLENSSNQIQRNGQDLTQNYQNLSNSTDANFTAETDTVENINSNISDQQAEIRAAEFTQTELSASDESSESSFIDPIIVSGELVDENGTALENETVQIQLGNGRVNNTTTDEDGEFSFLGRPTLLPLGEQSVMVRHVPNASSIYLGSNDTIQTDIQQVDPTITLFQSSKRAQFKKSVTVSGRVHVEDVSANGVPVVIRSGQTVLGVVKTDSDGRFTLSEPLPKSVLHGQKQISATVPLRDRALASTTTSAPLTVQPTNTRINLTGQAFDHRNISVQGNLTTAAGVAIPNETVVFRHNGSQIGTAKTDRNGTYNTQIHLPPKLAEKKDKSQLRLSAAYAGNQTSLNPSNAGLTVQFDSESLFDGSALIWISIVGLLSFIAMSGFAIQRSDWFSKSEEVDDSEQFIEEAVIESDTNEEVITTEVTTSLLVDRAKTAVTEGNFQTSIEMAYAAGRRHFLSADDSISEAGQTHWEFYQMCEDKGFSDRQLEQLHELTQLYEQATFTTNMLSRESAERAIEIASTYKSNRK